jgi:hypothetical protein
MNRHDFVAELHATHQPVAAAVEDLTDQAWLEAAPGMDGWTRKDVLAHIGWWSDHSVRVITALTAGGIPYERDPGLDIDTQNRMILDELRDRALADIVDFEATAFARLVAAVEASSEEDLFAAKRFAWLGDESLAEAVAWDSTRHYPAHLPNLAT